MTDVSTLIMANHPDLLEKLERHLAFEYKLNDGSTPWWVLRSLISSPRLADVYVSGFDPDGYAEVGDTFLDKHTMLARFSLQLNVLKYSGMRVGLSQNRSKLWPGGTFPKPNRLTMKMKLRRKCLDGKLRPFLTRIEIWLAS